MLNIQLLLLVHVLIQGVNLSIYEKHDLWDLTVTVAASASDILLKYYTMLVSLIKNAPQAIVF